MIFQFHKGTIRTNGRVALIPSDIYFNSIKVRLEPLNLHIDDASIEFQFHKGTIRTFRLDVDTRDYQIFQFHKGTIRTYRAPVLGAHTLKFQFHKGTIRTP